MAFLAVICRKEQATKPREGGKGPQEQTAPKGPGQEKEEKDHKNKQHQKGQAQEEEERKINTTKPNGAEAEY